MLAIEIVEGCNFDCYFCRAQHVKSNQYFNLDLFKRVVTEAESMGISKLKLTPCRGEPFLHPQIYELLEFACDHMQEVLMFTNATAINVSKLTAIRHSGLILNISHYGVELNRFIELTRTTKHMHEIFNQRLVELQQAGIQHTIHRRDVNYVFDYDGDPRTDLAPIDPTQKCIHHQQPKILVDGSVVFCSSMREEAPNSKAIFYVNINDVSLSDALSHPLRYKFYDTQAVCSHIQCTSYAKNYGIRHSLTSMRQFAIAKTKYNADPATTDAAFTHLLNDVKNSSIQPSQQ